MPGPTGAVEPFKKKKKKKKFDLHISRMDCPGVQPDFRGEKQAKIRLLVTYGTAL
jgi:hypothetical protein